MVAGGWGLSLLPVHVAALPARWAAPYQGMETPPFGRRI